MGTKSGHGLIGCELCGFFTGICCANICVLYNYVLVRRYALIVSQDMACHGREEKIQALLGQAGLLLYLSRVLFEMTLIFYNRSLPSAGWARRMASELGAICAIAKTTFPGIGINSVEVRTALHGVEGGRMCGYATRECRDFFL